MEAADRGKQGWRMWSVLLLISLIPLISAIRWERVGKKEELLPTKCCGVPDDSCYVESTTTATTSTLPPYCPPRPDPKPGPPVLETVRMRWRFTSSTALILQLEDSFCAGQRYRIRDNGRLIADDASLATVCGVSTTSKAVIWSPQFMEVEYLLPAGQHNVSITILGSRVGSGVSTMAIRLLPFGPIDEGIDRVLEFKETCRIASLSPLEEAIDVFNRS